jgi:3-deoxy-D-arabino-heptulosonate 7-phosphate (DAHP) synthase
MAYNDVKKESYDIEKEPPSLREDIAVSSHDEYECEFTPAEQKKIIHRIDRRLVVTVGVLYCISLMDRTNLSAAAIAGYGPCLFQLPDSKLTNI